MNKLYASEVNVGYFNTLKPDGGGRTLSLPDKDSGTGTRIETSASEEPGEAREISPVPTAPS
jgi:hypothetical protein